LLFKVEAVHAIVARCCSLGATIVRGPEKKSSGGWTAIVADDDGNQLSLDQDEPNQAAS
jgi:predicted enzyme related to lactoylglutathione lyase